MIGERPRDVIRLRGASRGVPEYRMSDEAHPSHVEHAEDRLRRELACFTGRHQSYYQFPIDMSVVFSEGSRRLATHGDALWPLADIALAQEL